MKLTTVLLTPLLITFTSAWQVRFVSTGKNPKVIDAHGTQDTGCITLKWNPPQPVAKLSFNSATQNWPDPEKMTVYSDTVCKENGLTYFPGEWEHAKFATSSAAAKIGSYCIDCD